LAPGVIGIDDVPFLAQLVDQIRRKRDGLGGGIVETTGIPLGTADITPFLSKINGDFDGLFGIFDKDGITVTD
jgi:hypothetical protein